MSDSSVRLRMPTAYWNTRRFYLPAILALLCTSAFFVWKGWTERSHPVSGAYVGWTSQQIIDKLGEPQGRWPGHYGLPPINWAQRFEPCETFTYEISGGTLYISINQPDGRSVCFRSDWVPSGTIID